MHNNALYTITFISSSCRRNSLRPIFLPFIVITIYYIFIIYLITDYSERSSAAAAHGAVAADYVPHGYTGIYLVYVPI